MTSSSSDARNAAVGSEQTPRKFVDVSALKAKKGVFQWKAASIVSVVTLAVFAADFVFLEMNGENRAGFLGTDVLFQVGSLIRSGKLFALDCFMVVALLGFIIFKFGLHGKTDKSQSAKRAPSNKSANRRGPARKDDGAGSAGHAAKALPKDDAKTVPAERPVSRWNQAIDAAARQGDAKMAGRLLMEFERQAKDGIGNKPDTVSYNLVIRAYAKIGDFKGAEEWLERMEKKGLEATVCSYNTVLDSCAKADNAEACETWLETMLSKGVEANVISYATVIYARARRGEESLAGKWLKRMTDAGIEPDSVCYNSMIHACGVSGNASGAAHWIKELQARGLEASVTTFTSVIDSCAKAGDATGAEKWIEAMISAGIEPNVVSFSAMIDACAKASDPVRAAHWHDRMVQCNVTPNAHSYSGIINACAKAGDVSMAEEWLGRCEKAGQANDVVVYSSVIDACGKVGDAERAMAIFERMQAHGIRPHIVAYAALARPFAYRGDWAVVERIAREMTEAGITPNEYFLYAQLLSYATTRPRQSERAEKCFRDALGQGLKANDHVVSALARAVGRDRCTELMAELCQGRPVPFPPDTRRKDGPNAKAKPQTRR